MSRGHDTDAKCVPGPLESAADASMSAADVRRACRRRLVDDNTSWFAPGCAQANVLIIERDWARDFLLFCRENPKAFPVLAVLEPGDPRVPPSLASDCDIRTDLPRYRVWRNGRLEDVVHDVVDLWTKDMVTVLFGCSFSFEQALLDHGVPLRHHEEQCVVPMYLTSTPCHPAGRFRGHLATTMRPMTRAQAAVAAEVTAKFPLMHGSPIHVGDPAAIGVADVSKPDFGSAVTIREDEVCAFWACGVSLESVLKESSPPLAITQGLGGLLVLDVGSEELCARVAREGGVRLPAWVDAPHPEAGAPEDKGSACRPPAEPISGDALTSGAGAS